MPDLFKAYGAYNPQKQKPNFSAGQMFQDPSQASSNGMYQQQPPPQEHMGMGMGNPLQKFGMAQSLLQKLAQQQGPNMTMPQRPAPMMGQPQPPVNPAMMMGGPSNMAAVMPKKQGIFSGYR